jgi:hypothetical protein
VFVLGARLPALILHLKRFADGVDRLGRRH